jgi:hypothetical protein
MTSSPSTITPATDAGAPARRTAIVLGVLY